MYAVLLLIALAGKVKQSLVFIHSSLSLFALYIFLSQLTVELEFRMCMGRDHSSLWIESKGHRSGFGLGLSID